MASVKVISFRKSCRRLRRRFVRRKVLDNPQSSVLSPQSAAAVEGQREWWRQHLHWVVVRLAASIQPVECPAVSPSNKCHCKFFIPCPSFPHMPLDTELDMNIDLDPLYVSLPIYLAFTVSVSVSVFACSVWVCERLKSANSWHQVLKFTNILCECPVCFWHSSGLRASSAD